MQNAGTIYGYARVSTDAQDLSNQVAQLRAAGCDSIFREKMSGTTAERPQLKKLMKALVPGDVVITSAVDRLSRDTTDLLIIARDIQQAGAGLRSLAEPVLDTTGDFAELVLAMLGVAAKLERRRIMERTARGRADAKANGVRFGRKPSLTPHQQQEARKRIEVGETQRSVARSYNVSQATISRLAPAPSRSEQVPHADSAVDGVSGWLASGGADREGVDDEPLVDPIAYARAVLEPARV
jgi:DNA invertase Pin-like site-specific DNA recombinase